MPFVKRQRVTIRDVAREAGVSLQTVSRVVNSRPDVSESTRVQVQSVIDRLRYHPNGIARSLVGASTRTLGVIGSGFDYYGPSQLLVGVERQSTELGYHISLQVVGSRDPREYARIATNLISQSVSGVIWAFPELTGEHERAFHAQLAPHAPTIFLSMAPQHGSAVIGVDNRAGARLATEHLIMRGARRIGIITGLDHLWSAQQRELGWRDAMLAAGLPCDESWSARGNWTVPSGDAGLTRLLEAHPELDGVFVSNDQMALGALTAARRLGRRVPDDVRMVGFDNTPESAYFAPALTTIHNDLITLGRLAVRELDRVLDTDVEPASFELQPELIVRESA
jgi:LacI family transcriptional regulator